MKKHSFFTKRKQLLIAAAAGLFLSCTAQAQPPGTPDWWPCIQRYVPKLSVGTFWPGGLEAGNAWRENKEILRLAKRLGDRDISVQANLDDTKAFIASAADSKQAVEDLLRAMEHVVNENRNRIMQGISRFAKRQAMMIRRIEQQTQDLDAPGLTEEKKEDLEARQKWDIRVFEDREGMISYLCEQPVLLEKKFFAVGRAIAEARDKR